MPTPTRRQLFRAADCILASLPPPENEPLELPAYQWQRLQTILALADHAKRRGWRHAARRCRERLRWPLEELRQSLQAIERELNAPVPYRTTLAELYADLAALQHDFDDLRIDLAESTLSVVTEPVALESVDLGRFEIELQWNRLRSSSFPYLVRALDGQGAAADSSVTHPHVRDEQLCEGDAYSALRAALRSGRLLDFFTIVAQTLAAYNGDSAYVRLEFWEGVSCADCGQTVTDDDRSCCERCESTLCSDCTSGCSACGTSLCSSCSASCAVCCDAHCPSWGTGFGRGWRSGRRSSAALIRSRLGRRSGRRLRVECDSGPTGGCAGR